MDLMNNQQKAQKWFQEAQQPLPQPVSTPDVQTLGTSQISKPNAPVDNSPATPAMTFSNIQGKPGFANWLSKGGVANINPGANAFGVSAPTVVPTPTQPGQPMFQGYNKDEHKNAMLQWLLGEGNMRPEQAAELMKGQGF